MDKEAWHVHRHHRSPVKRWNNWLYIFQSADRYFKAVLLERQITEIVVEIPAGLSKLLGKKSKEWEHKFGKFELVFLIMK